MQEVTLDTPPGTRFVLVVRPTYHPRKDDAGVIDRVWEFTDWPVSEPVRADVTFDSGRKTTIAVYCIRAVTEED